MNMRGFIYGLLFSIFACIFVSPTSSATQADSLWPKTGTYTVNQTPSIDYDSIKLCTQQSIKTIYFLNYPATTSSSCIHETAYGSYADSGYLKRFVGDYVKVAANVIPVPNTSKMYVSYCGYPCRLLYYDTTQGFSGSTSNYGYRLTPKASPIPVSNPANGSALEVYSIGFSQNGKWLAIETSGGFVRYSTETGEFLKFSKHPGSYGGGQAPSFKYSVTDDGRYVILSGNNYRYATVFDLATCTGGSMTDPVGVVATCESTELLDVVRKSGYNVSGLYGVAFRAGGREITAYGSENNGNDMRGYTVRLDSLEARADYVALGDSFSSGEGDMRDNTHYLPGTDGSSEYPMEKCHISNRSYPFLLQKQNTDQLNFSKNFTCSGAKANDIVGFPSDKREIYIGQFRQGDNVSDLDYGTVKESAIKLDTPGRVGQYKFLEKYQPKNITITIGGNDAGFGDVVASCVTVGTCNFESTERAAKGLEMASKYQILRDAYRKIRNASPDANLYVLSYPQFIDDNNQCNPNVGMNSAERTFVRESVSYFNQVIRQAALAEGATYIDIADSLKGEALCSSKLLGLAVNGIVEGNDQYAVIGQESFHPNSRGHELIAAYIKETYGVFPNLAGETCPTTSCSNYLPPALPDYFNVLPTTVQRYKAAIIQQAQATYAAGSKITVTLKNFIPNAIGYVSIHSNPQSLGTIVADASGEFSATVTLPTTLEPGYHELNIETKALDGTKISYYQPLTVIASEDDVDGDGLRNADDPCNFVEAAQVDVDGDGIDDGCDGDLYIAPTPVAELSNTSPSTAPSLQAQSSALSAQVAPVTTTVASLASETTSPMINEMTYGKVAGASVDNSQAIAKAEPTQDNYEQKSPSKVVFGAVVIIVMLVIAAVLFRTSGRT